MEGIDGMAESSKKNEKTKSFLIRLASTVVMLTLGGGAIYIGKWVLAVVLLAVSLGGVFELLRVFNVHKTSLAVVTYIFTVLYNVLLYVREYVTAGPAGTELLLFILYLLIILTIYVFRFPKHDIKQTVSCFFSFFYVPVCLSYIEQLRNMEHGFYFVILILICSCGNDMFAYLVGILIGKHKMFPHLSPKKSVEGFIGGILGAAGLGVAYGFIYQNITGSTTDHFPLLFGIICGVGALPAVVGDLAASGIKRNYGIKDYSHLIPGHGGIMDRFDSMIFTAPIVFYMVTFLFQMYR